MVRVHQVESVRQTNVWAGGAGGAGSQQGPQSLPSELLSEAGREVRRLQELRRYIQEECDQLLLRKERLKEEVVWHAEHNFATLDCLMSSNSLHVSHYKRGGSARAEERDKSPLSEEVCMQITRETSL